MNVLLEKKEEIVFAAFGGWDANGAKNFGYTTYWVNRFNLPAEKLGIEAVKTSNHLEGLLNFVLDRHRIKGKSCVRACRHDEALGKRVRSMIGSGGDRPEERSEPFRHRWVGQDRVAQGRVREPRGYRDLDGRHDFAGPGGERREAEDAVAVGGDQGLVEPARLGERPGAEDRGNGDLR
jgi:hypothetical protein